mmetsp:Transcript_9686/g.18808  ORF Transcript_9686/g.18808 Transcript_9686/m.18808 type:complete len:1192 (+) Transcript_9686:600-4175(+)
MCPAGRSSWRPVFPAESRFQEAKAQTRTIKKAAATASWRDQASAFVSSLPDRDQVSVQLQIGIDTCCTISQVYRRDLLHDVRALKYPVVLTVAGTEKPTCTETGTLFFRFEGGERVFSMEMLVNPYSPHNLFANDDLIQLLGGAREASFLNMEFELDGAVHKMHRSEDGLPCAFLKVLPPPPRSLRGGACASSAKRDPDKEYSRQHSLLLHSSQETVVKTVQKAKGLGSAVFGFGHHHVCPPCQFAKKKAPRRGKGNWGVSVKVEKVPAKLMSADNFGPFRTPCILGGELYFLLVVDAYTTYSFVKLMKSKGETLDKLFQTVIEARARSGYAGAITIISDGDSVFSSDPLLKRCTEHDVAVEQRHSPPYCPMNNPYAERHGGVIKDGARSMMVEAMFPPCFWGLMILLACFIRNRMVRGAADKNKSMIAGYAPIEIFEPNGEIDFSRVYLTGSLCYWYVVPERRVDPKHGKRAGVGVYIMPGWILGMQGHVVFSDNYKFKIVPEIKVVEGCYPFRESIEREMLNMSFSLLPPPTVDRADADGMIEYVLDVESHVMPDGVYCKDLIGAAVVKKYVDNLTGVLRPYHGVVTDADFQAGSNVVLFVVLFEDEEADFEYEELKEILVDSVGDAGSTEHDGFSRGTALVVGRSLLRQQTAAEPGMDELMSVAGRSEAACASSSAPSTGRKKKTKNKPPRADAETMPDTYTWNWARKNLSPVSMAQHTLCMLGEMNKLLDMGAVKWTKLPRGKRAMGSVGVFRWKDHQIHAVNAHVDAHIGKESLAHEAAGVPGDPPRAQPLDQDAHKMWEYDRVEGPNGPTLKARWCANGPEAAAPSEGWELSAKVASVSHILLVLSIAVALGFVLKQMDVKSAFTQVPVEEGVEIFIKPLPGLEKTDDSNAVIQLINHLYGHPLANAAWSAHWTKLMRDFGFKIVDRDECVFRYESDRGTIIVATVVDDSVCAYDNEELFQEFVSFIKKGLPLMKEPVTVTELEMVCGVALDYDEKAGTLKCSQTGMIEKVVAKYGIDLGGKVVESPMASDYVASKERPEVPDEERVSLARSLVGSLIYLTITRPEIRYACSKLARVVTNPTEVEIAAMKRVMRYLYDTRHTPLMFRRGAWTGPNGTVYPPNTLVGSVDASWGGEERHSSQTGIVFLHSSFCVISSCAPRGVLEGFTISVHSGFTISVFSRSLCR